MFNVCHDVVVVTMCLLRLLHGSPARQAARKASDHMRANALNKQAQSPSRYTASAIDARPLSRSTRPPPLAPLPLPFFPRSARTCLHQCAQARCKSCTSLNTSYMPPPSPSPSPQPPPPPPPPSPPPLSSSPLLPPPPLPLVLLPLLLPLMAQVNEVADIGCAPGM